MTTPETCPHCGLAGGFQQDKCLYYNRDIFAECRDASCYERELATLRAALAAKEADAAVMRSALEHSNIWVKAALNCKAWVWTDGDQRDCAEESVEDAEKALATAAGKPLLEEVAELRAWKEEAIGKLIECGEAIIEALQHTDELKVEHAKATARIAVLEGALNVERAHLLKLSNGRTHWDGCAQEHPVCAALTHIEEALATGKEPTP